ncbi:MAG: sigma-70 family RNA polymerase sigma factor [Acidobacteria bacterium]|nr:sigma-70 family RNA polymerase sigma factor [Acidobacteriota bacterium]
MDREVIEAMVTAARLSARGYEVEDRVPVTWPLSYEDREDHDLVAATREGDEVAFGELIRRYRSPITNYVYRIVSDYDMAIDLAQETFVRVYTSASRYRADHSFSTYIYRIATNLAISELRRRKRWRFVGVLTPTGASRNGEDSGEVRELDLPDPRPHPESEFIRAERQQVVARAVASLPEKYRAPLVLRDLEEFEYGQIAEILHLPVGTVKSRINRARHFLREKLQGYVQ